MANNDLFKELKQDHETVLSVLEQLEKTTARGRKTREDLFRRLTLELVPHMKAEEKTLYMAMMDGKEGKRLALEAVEEHRLGETLMNEIQKLSPEDDRWAAKIKVLREVIEHHIEEEEGELFKEARSELKQQLPAIHERFLREKQTVRTRIG